jgi:hypothetical protein
VTILHRTRVGARLSTFLFNTIASSPFSGIDRLEQTLGIGEKDGAN